MSVCHPTSTLDSGQQREPLADIPHENTGPSLVQRCVVVQKDQLGFDFTVCARGSSWCRMSDQDRPLQQPSPSYSPSPLTSYPIRGCHWEMYRNTLEQGEAELQAGKTQIIGPEEEEEEEDGYTLNEMDGPFQDIELLKSRPAHMTVFMRYIFSQLLDPNPLLFYLSLEAYLGSSPKDARALAPQICSYFLDPDASRLHAQEDIRGPLSELQQQVLPDIQDPIQDYRNKQMMGLGSLFGEGDLQQLDGDPAKEKQVTALWEILSKHEDDRSSPLASAVLLHLRHSGIKLRDSRVFPGLSSEKEKWLAFFPKTKKLSMRPGSVRNIIQQFENHTEIPGEEGAEGDPQRLSLENPTPPYTPRWTDRPSSTLLTTEASHLRTLRVLDQVFFRKMRCVLNSDELACIFPNLPQVYELHESLCEAMKKKRESPIVQGIGGSTDLPPLQRAQACCRGILQAVNEVVRETEHRQRLNQYQRRLDPTPQFKSLDLTSKTMIHEGPLTWKVNKDKTLEIQALLLSDLLVLLQRGPDDRLLLRCPSRWLGGGGGGSGDTKASFSPVVQLDSLLVRSVATDNKALYVISTTERQIYELVAGSSSEKNTWKDQLEKTISLAAGSSPLTNNRSTPIFSPSLGNASPVSTGSHVYQSDNSMTEQVVFMETDSPNDEDNELTPTTPTDQSGAFLYGEGRDYVKKQIGVAEAALEDVEMLRQLILRDLEEDGWSHDSVGTPTNEAANERSPFNDRQRPASSETLLSVSPSQWEAEHAEAPPSEVESPSVHVVRKGNVFYLVMPPVQGEGLLDESHTDEVDDPTTPTSTELPDLEQEVMSSPVQTHEKEGQVVSIMSADNQSERGNLSREEGQGQSQKSHQSHVIKNMDEIFHTIEELMSKLHQLRDIETAHHQLLKTLREPPVNPESGDLFRNQGTVARTPFLYRDLGDDIRTHTDGLGPQPLPPNPLSHPSPQSQQALLMGAESMKYRDVIGVALGDQEVMQD
ncbi:unnamed protein product [Coregonus sp. 'balchen']|nr:unnamed protein product [Coregonus sp. 'balchen']